jgi:purine-binding chemotaxis protein CheW
VHNVALAVPAEFVGSVSAVNSPTPLPGAPPHIIGLVAVGERVLPLVDLQILFGIGGSEPVDPLFRRTLFVTAGDLEAGLVCHRARGLIAVTESELKEPTVLQGERLRPFLAAEVEAQDRVVGVLDVAAVLKAAAVS